MFGTSVARQTENGPARGGPAIAGTTLAAAEKGGHPAAGSGLGAQEPREFLVERAWRATVWRKMERQVLKNREQHAMAKEQAHPSWPEPHRRLSIIEAAGSLAACVLFRAANRRVPHITLRLVPLRSENKIACRHR